MVATGETTREPIRNGDADQALPSASVENDGVKRAEWRHALRDARNLGRLPTPHVEERSLTGKTRT